MEWWEHLPDVLQFVVLLAAAITAVTIFHKYVGSPLLKWFRKLDAGVDSILGYGPVLDPGTGAVIQEETEPLAVRVRRLEDAHVTAAEALRQIAQNQGMLLNFDERLLSLNERVEQADSEFRAWVREHEAFSRQWVMAHEDAHGMPHSYPGIDDVPEN